MFTRMLTWKRFSFFNKEVLQAPEVKQLDVTTVAAGHGFVFLGDGEGGITTMVNNFVERKFAFSTFRAYDQRVTHLQVLQKTLLVSIGDGVDARAEGERALARKFVQLHSKGGGQGQDSGEPRGMLQPMRAMPMRLLSDRPSGAGRMIRGKETGKEKVEMVRARGKEEAKPVVAKAVLPKEAVSFAEVPIGHPSAYRTVSIKTNQMPLHPQARVDPYLSCAQ